MDDVEKINRLQKLVNWYRRDPSRWLKRRLFVLRDNKVPTGRRVNRSDIVQCCVEGGLYKFGLVHDLYDVNEVLYDIAEANRASNLGFNLAKGVELAPFNDSTATTFYDIVRLLEKTIQYLRSRIDEGIGEG